MVGEQRDLGFRLWSFLYDLPGVTSDIGVGQAVLTRVGFADLVGRIPQGVSAWVWCQKAFEAFVDTYPEDTPQQVERLLVRLATTDLSPITDLSLEDKTRLEEWRVEARGLSCEELRRLLAPGKWVSRAVSSIPDEITAQIQDQRAQQAADAPVGPIVPSPRKVFRLLDLEDQVAAFKNANPGYALGGVYPCVMSGNLIVIENWLVPRLLKELMPTEIAPKVVWLYDKDMPADGRDGRQMLEIISHKLDHELGQDLSALVRQGRDPCLVLINTYDITASAVRRLASVSAADATFRSLNEQARRNSVLLIIAWAAEGVLEPAKVRTAGPCIIPVGNMERHALLRKLRDCLEEEKMQEAEIDKIVGRWANAVGDEIGAAPHVYQVTWTLFGGL